MLLNYIKINLIQISTCNLHERKVGQDGYRLLKEEAKYSQVLEFIV